MIFRYNESAGVSSLDPAYSRNLENIWVCNMLYNGLVEIDDSLNIRPAISDRWTIDSTGTVYRFHLRDDVFFHESEAFPNGEGRRVVAGDFVYSFNRILDRKLSSPGSWVFGAVATEKPFRAIGDSIVEIHLEKQFPPFLGLLGMKYCSVVPREAVEKYGDDFRKNPVGTGPFKFNFWIENTRLVMLKNENYYETDKEGNALPYLDAVSVSFIPDKSAAYLDLVKGNFDFMSGLHSSYADELITPDGELVEIYRDQFYLQKHPFLKTDYLGFMIDDSLAAGNPWLNVDLRKAVNYAINRVDMVRYLRNNVYTPGTAGFIPKGMPGYRANSGYSFNPDSVRACIERAGYGNGKKLPILTVSTTSDYVDLCEFVQHQVSQFGFEVKVDVLPASVHRELTARGDVEFFRKSWLADYPDDENFMALFYSPNKSPKGPNYTHFSDPRFDKLYLDALATTNQQERNTLYAQMDSLMMTEAPIVPLYYDVVMRFVSKKVCGLDQSPISVLDLRHVKIELEE
ncbi:ABC transporter substrate-binding protein [Cryomorpha ignava]|uniref:ABC transporter substrate-binding protein n=2 Tax=Cryomorpha ignava TaxID=101383 RepID=A0A7K3WNH6_9FLAO|nr:ABC transporter substrate-binding protein [Cryomorpha ignava]